MAIYQVHPDGWIILRMVGADYMDTPENFALDAGVPAVTPKAGNTELWYHATPDGSTLSNVRYEQDHMNPDNRTVITADNVAIDDVLTRVPAIIAAKAARESAQQAANMAAQDSAMTYLQKRRRDILMGWDMAAQLEAITESMAGRPEKYNKLMADIDAIKVKHPIA